MPAEYSTRRNHHSDPWNMEEVSLDVVRCVPPEPYTLLQPLVLIQEGDIRKDLEVEGGQWEPIRWGEDGLYTPRSGVAYARVEAPEMYRLVGAGHVIGWGDLYWETGGGEEWQDVSGIAAGTRLFGRDAGEVGAEAAREERQLFIASPDDEMANHRVKPVPGRHRPLFVGEKLRRGDKVLVKGLVDWREVTERMRGWVVEAAGERNGWARYCRPVDAGAQAWYVDNETGREGGLGSAIDPFVSVEVAQVELEKRENPQGTVWTLGGQPLLVYDLPEPRR